MLGTLGVHIRRGTRLRLLILACQTRKTDHEKQDAPENHQS
jgi:hypothetical protein